MPSFKLDGVHRLVPAPRVSDVRLAAAVAFHSNRVIPNI
jgi:hypothetical protein